MSFGALLGLLVSTSVAAPAFAAPPPPSALTVSVLNGSATWSQTYGWTLTATSSPASVTLSGAATATLTDTLTLTKRTEQETLTASGTVCVTNNGTSTTEGLSVYAEGKPAAATKMSVSTLLSINPPDLAPGASGCYGFIQTLPGIYSPAPLVVTAHATSMVHVAFGAVRTEPTPAVLSVVPPLPLVSGNNVTVPLPGGTSWVASSSGTQTTTHVVNCSNAGAHYAQYNMNEFPKRTAFSHYTVHCPPVVVAVPPPAPTPTPSAVPGPGFSFTRITPDQYITAGGASCYRLNLRNTGTAGDTYSLSTTNSTAGYTSAVYRDALCSTAAPSWPVAGGASYTVYVKVQVPPRVGTTLPPTNTMAVRAASVATPANFKIQNIVTYPQ